MFAQIIKCGPLVVHGLFYTFTFKHIPNTASKLYLQLFDWKILNSS